MYISYCIKKNLNILQIYLYYLNIYFGLGSGGFQVEYDNIHTLSIIHRVQKIHTHLGWVESVSIRIGLNCHP
jgi:hypothetical protein